MNRPEALYQYQLVGWQPREVLASSALQPYLVKERNLMDSITSQKNALPYKGVNRGTLITNAEVDRFNGTLDDIDESMKFYNGLIIDYQDRRSKSAPYDQLDRALYVAGILGAHLTTHDAYKRYKNYHLPTVHDAIDDIAYVKGGTVNLNLHGINVAEFKKQNTEFSPVELFRFLTDVNKLATEELQDSLCQEVYDQNQPQSTKFLFHTIQHIGFLSAVNLLLTEGLEETVGRAVQGEGKTVIGKCFKNIKAVIENIKKNSQAVNNILFNPRDSQFYDLQPLMEKYLEEGSTDALLFSGILSQEDLVQSYRKAQRFVREGSEYSSFYQRYIVALENVIKGKENILTKEDVGLFIDEDRTNSNDEVISVDSLVSIGSQINNNWRNDMFDIDPEKIDWESMVIPDQVTVKFTDPNGSNKKLTVTFSHINELGETLHHSIYIDKTKKSTSPFEWDFLEDPNSEMENLYALYTRLAERALKDALKQATQHKEDKRAGRAPINISPTKKLPFDHDVLMRERSEAVTHSQEQAIPIESAIFREDREAKKKKIVYRVDVSDRPEIKSHYSKRMISSDVDLCMDVLDNLTLTREKKNFKHLEGIDLYVVRVSTPTHNNGMRVLLREVDGEDGIRYFEIVDIGYRKDIYRKLKRLG